MRPKIYCLSIIILLIFSCDKDSDIKPLEMQELLFSWQLDYFINKETQETIYLPEPYSAGITFHGKDCIHVVGPCNSGPGKYVLNKNDVIITILAMTERGCKLDETIFTGNLSGTYSINEDNLIIDSDNDYNLVLIRTDLEREYDCYDF